MKQRSSQGIRDLLQARKERILLPVIVLLLIAAMLSVKTVYTTLNEAEGDTRRWLVVIDPGHGGFDPGKVGVGEVLEKDINLAISLKLKALLEQNDVTVVMTREKDEGLSKSGESSKKNSDMRNRVGQVNRAGADVAVSIHQNSFTESSSRGAQVFYHGNSEEGKVLAEILQEQLKETLQDGNHRMAKSNDSYYMLKKTECPFAIVECGFLSNPDEAALLQEESYQEKVAWAIHLGILQYLNKEP